MNKVVNLYESFFNDSDETKHKEDVVRDIETQSIPNQMVNIKDWDVCCLFKFAIYSDVTIEEQLSEIMKRMDKVKDAMNQIQEIEYNDELFFSCSRIDEVYLDETFRYRGFLCCGRQVLDDNMKITEIGVPVYMTFNTNEGIPVIKFLNVVLLNIFNDKSVYLNYLKFFALRYETDRVATIKKVLYQNEWLGQYGGKQLGNNIADILSICVDVDGVYGRTANKLKKSLPEMYMKYRRKTINRVSHDYKKLCSRVSLKDVLNCVPSDTSMFDGVELIDPRNGLSVEQFSLSNNNYHLADVHDFGYICKELNYFLKSNNITFDVFLEWSNNGGSVFFLNVIPNQTFVTDYYDADEQSDEEEYEDEEGVFHYSELLVKFHVYSTKTAIHVHNNPGVVKRFLKTMMLVTKMSFDEAISLYNERVDNALSDEDIEFLRSECLKVPVIESVVNEGYFNNVEKDSDLVSDIEQSTVKSGKEGMNWTHRFVIQYERYQSTPEVFKSDLFNLSKRVHYVLEKIPQFIEYSEFEYYTSVFTRCTDSIDIDGLKVNYSKYGQKDGYELPFDGTIINIGFDCICSFKTMTAVNNMLKGFIKIGFNGNELLKVFVKNYKQSEHDLYEAEAPEYSSFFIDDMYNRNSDGLDSWTGFLLRLNNDLLNKFVKTTNFSFADIITANLTGDRMGAVTGCKVKEPFRDGTLTVYEIGRDNKKNGIRFDYGMIDHVWRYSKRAIEENEFEVIGKKLLDKVNSSKDLTYTFVSTSLGQTGIACYCIFDELIEVDGFEYMVEISEKSPNYDQHKDIAVAVKMLMNAHDYSYDYALKQYFYTANVKYSDDLAKRITDEFNKLK